MTSVIAHGPRAWQESTSWLLRAELPSRSAPFWTVRRHRSQGERSRTPPTGRGRERHLGARPLSIWTVLRPWAGEDLTDSQVVPIPCWRRVVDRHNRAGGRRRCILSLHPVRVAGRREVLVDQRLVWAYGPSDRAVVVVAHCKHPR